MKTKLAALIAIGAILASAVGVFAASKDVTSLRSFSSGSPAGGKSTLTRDDTANKVSSQINATHLMRGAAYTYWYVIFNRPELCSAPGCGEDDIFLPNGNPNFAQIANVGIAVLGGNGQIAGKGGQATFTGMLFEGTPAGLNVVIGPGGLIPAGPGMLMVGKTMTAEIHIVLRNHGTALTGADLAEQLSTFAGNCLGLDGNGTFSCADEQFAEHKP